MGTSNTAGILSGLLQSGALPDLLPSMPSMLKQSNSEFKVSQQQRNTQKTAASTAASAKNMSPFGLAIDPTTAWLYCILWYLLQQFVRNNTTTDLILMRPPGSVAVADNLRVTFWWMVMFGAICWLCLLIVLVFVDHYTYDFGASSGLMTRLFTS